MKHKTPLPNLAHAHRTVAHTMIESTPSPSPRIFGMTDAEAMLTKYTSWRAEASAAQLDPTIYDKCITHYAELVQRERGRAQQQAAGA